jgi:hypothetical protein
MNLAPRLPPPSRLRRPVAPEWALRLTPKPFRDFVPYAPLSALGVIHPGKVLRHALQIAQHYGSDTARARAAQILSASLEGTALPVRIVESPGPPLDVRQLGPETRRAIGANVLGLYFHQLYAQAPWFLDLRPRNFSWSAADDSLAFFPNGLWYEPSADFKQRVRALYRGFYCHDKSALENGVELYSWGSRPAAGFPQRIELLLREHFGSGDDAETRFSIAHFRSTFELIFREAAASGAKLHPELTFLGVGLVGLYLTLEQLQVPLAARHAFAASARHYDTPEAT